MNRKRLGQILIGGIFALCAAVAAALMELVTDQDAKNAADSGKAPEQAENISDQTH